MSAASQDSGESPWEKVIGVATDIIDAIGSALSKTWDAISKFLGIGEYAIEAAKAPSVASQNALIHAQNVINSNQREFIPTPFVGELQQGDAYAAYCLDVRNSGYMDSFFPVWGIEFDDSVTWDSYSEEEQEILSQQGLFYFDRQAWNIINGNAIIPLISSGGKMVIGWVS